MTRVADSADELDDGRHRCGKHDKIRVGQIGHRRSPFVDEAARQRLARRRRSIDAQDAHGRPGCPRAQRDRSADETEADDPDSGKRSSV